MATEIFVFLGIVIPAVAAIVVALIKTQRRPGPIQHVPPTPIEVVQSEVKDLKLQLERQHIKIDDITERLAWLEGNLDKQ